MTIADWKPLNKEQAEALFAEYAILLHKCDGIPVHIAAQLLPPETVAYIRTWQGGEYWNSAGLNRLLPDGMVDWLTKAGFMAAVSEANCLCMWPEQRNETCSGMPNGSAERQKKLPRSNLSDALPANAARLEKP